MNKDDVKVIKTRDVTLTGLNVTDPLTGAALAMFARLRLHTSVSRDWSYDVCSSDLDHHGSNAVDLTTDNKITNTATAVSDQTTPLSSSVDTPITFADRKSVV